MKALCSSLCLAAVMVTGAQGHATSTGLQVDVVHYWISNSESAVFHGDRDAVLAPSMREALDRLRRVSRFAEPATARAGRTWADATRKIGRGVAGMQLMGDWAKGELVSLGYTEGQGFGCSFIPGTSATHFMAIDGFAFPLTARDGAVHAQHTFARMVLEPDNQLAFSRLKGSLPVRTDIDPTELDHCGQLGLQRIRDEAHHDGVHSRAMPSHTMAA